MFRVCGINHYENTHSAIIAEFLNPDGKHGLKSKLLECFIETVGEKITLQNFNCGNAQIRTEHSTEEGRIDILITDDQNKAIIIENKIYATDQSEQLIRYNRYAQKAYGDGNYQILYLTLSGNEASEQSSKGVSYLPISHERHIIDWLEKCVAIASRFPMVRETIIQYVNHLKQLTGQDMDAKNKEEITKVLSENLKTAHEIYRNYSGVYDFLAKEHFNLKMRGFAEQKGLDYHYDRSEERYMRFHFTNSNWEEKYWIEFRMEGDVYFYGLCSNPAICRISDDNRKKIHDNLNRLGVAGKASDWWAFYEKLPTLSLTTWGNDIIGSDKFLNDCKGKIETLLKAMEGVEL